jgi:hypothetical protein
MEKFSIKFSGFKQNYKRSQKLKHKSFEEPIVSTGSSPAKIPTHLDVMNYNIYEGDTGSIKQQLTALINKRCSIDSQFDRQSPPLEEEEVMVPTAFKRVYRGMAARLDAGAKDKKNGVEGEDNTSSLAEHIAKLIRINTATTESGDHQSIHPLMSNHPIIETSREQMESPRLLTDYPSKQDVHPMHMDFQRNSAV